MFGGCDPSVDGRRGVVGHVNANAALAEIDINPIRNAAMR
jgi:hypothetical protein